MQKLNQNSILKENNWKKRPDGRYQNPNTNRPYTKEKALDKIAKDSGYKSYNDYKQIRRNKTYKYFEEWAEKKNKSRTLGKDFAKKFAVWKKAKFERKSKAMRDLLSYFDWLNASNRYRYE